MKESNCKNSIISHTYKILFVLFFFSGSFCFTQKLTPYSINSGGSKISKTFGSLSFTIGEFVIIVPNDSLNNKISNGFTSSSVLTTINMQNSDTSVFKVNVFPNPTTELVKIQILFSTYNQILLTVTDLQGKIMYDGKYYGVSNTIGINTSDYSKGIYLLDIKNTNNQTLGSYKIIKH
jgi:hypothetical protein